MQVSDEGLLEICEHEGIVPAPYLDSVGVWTYGVGHTAAAGGLDPATMPRGMPENVEAAISHAVEVFRQDVKRYEARVNSAITVPLKQHEFDALVSFDFNTGGIHRAKLTAAINARDPEAARHFMGWLKPVEIRRRRTAEMRLFQTGNYDANGDAIPVWSVNASGKLRGVLRTMKGRNVLARMKVSAPKSSPKETPMIGIAAAASGYKTYIIGAVIVAIGITEGLLGYDIPGVEVGPDWMTYVLNGLGLGTLRAGIAKAALGRVFGR